MHASLVKMVVLQQQPEEGVLESASCERSVPNTKTLDCTALYVRFYCA